MREIKFRGKRVDNQQWVFGYYVVDSIGNQIVCADSSCFNVCPETVGQYTGLKDKNGKEIYEGHQLFVCAGYASYVDFQDGMFVSVHNHPEDGEVIPLIDVIGNDTEIIGNIHDNHEILNQ